MKINRPESKATAICRAFEIGRRAYHQGKSIYACAYSDNERTIAYERGWRFEKERQHGKARTVGAR